MVGCRTTRQTTSETAAVHNRENFAFRADSIYVEKFDSIFTLVKGDSVFVDRWRIEYKYRVQQVTDSVIIRDSIYFNNEVVVEKQPSFWDKLKIIAEGFVVGIIIGLLLTKLRR